MLESIRSGAQSFGVKVAFGLIILVFVFWGVGNYNDRDYTNVVAVVNGEPIVAMQFEKAYHDTEEYLLRNNPGLTREQLTKEHLGRQVLRDLIQQMLLAQEAKRAGVEVSPQEMRLAVSQMKAFQDEQGKFDPEAYKRVLAAQRVTPAQFEKDIADQLLRDKMFALVTAPGWVDPDEAQNRFNFLRERRLVDYLFLPASAYSANITVPEADIKSWYDSHQADYAIPPTVDVAYIAVRPEDLADRGSIGEDKARAWYEANKGRYERQEQVHASHILVPLPPGADEEASKAAEAKLAEAAAKINSGSSFASVADEMNEEGAAGKGGELGWISRGQTVPEFEEAVFALPVGQLSGPVRTPFGYHLIMVTDKKAAGIAPFEEVAEEIYANLAAEAGADKLHDAIDTLIEDNILQKPLDQAAARYGLSSEQSGLLDKKGLMDKLGVTAEGADALLAIPAGAPLDTALEAGNRYIVARVTRAEPAGTKSLTEVSGDIAEKLAHERGLGEAMKKAQDILLKVREEPFAKAKADYPDIKESQPLERGGMLLGFRPDDLLMEGIFETPAGKWMDAPRTVTKGDGQTGAIIAYVGQITPPDSADFAGVSEMLANAVKQQRMEGLYNIFMQQLARNAKVEIVNQNLVDRINM